MVDSSVDYYAQAPAIDYNSGKALMEHGSEALHDHFSSRVEAAMGKSLPQMEVRFKNLSISAELEFSSTDSQKDQLPTIANDIAKMFSGFRAKKTKVTKHILKDVNGVFKPGSMTLVLGQPGSGKSSLMKALSGRFPMSKNVKFEGDITYNGTPREEIVKRMPQYVSYVTQRDNHFPTLSVKETLEFAHECCGGELSERDEKHFISGSPEENKAALEAARAIYKHYPDVIIQQLGLENCQDTIVGNAMLRGVSGGERKRVTTGEMQFGNKYVMLMDEISTGLDSAATYDIIKTQRSVAKRLRKTVVISLLQPSPDVFALFDDVLILNDGRVMYHGPRDQVHGYFEGLGFHCPPRRDVADYLLDLGTRQQQQYEVARADGSKHPRKASEFAEVFAKSAIHDAMLKDLHGAHDPALLRDKEQHFDEIPEFHQTFWASTATLVAREIKVTMRNTAFIQGRAFMVVVMGLLYSSAFWQFDPEDIQIVMGILFAAVLFLAMGQASQIPTVMEAREVFYKQRGANFYRTSSYVLACSVGQIPLALVESVVFGSMVYWMCGFVSSISGYLVFLLLLFVTDIAFAALFFLVGVASPNLNVANPISMVITMFFCLFAGFVISRNTIPDYLIWVYWLNPVSWCMRSMGVNQYRNDHFDVDVYKGINYKERFGLQMGEYLLGLFDVQSEKEWLWYGVIYIVASYAVFTWLSYVTLEYMRFESPENIGLSGEEGIVPVAIESSGDSSDSDYGLIQTPRGDVTDEIILQVKPTSREKHFVPVTLAFKDLWYTVPNPSDPKEGLDLLKGISGYAMPGTITALMGSSGAGKTTLMDVIAGRKTGGKIRGQILLNGYEATDLAIRRATGYCEQMDIHSEAATFREALTFSAFLRQDASVSDAQKYDSVEECLDLLDMHPIADQIIRGSSVEQMKRLTIGVELAAQPSVLFLDEPTSGLDARSAKMIMDGVRKVANTGRTVVCTIHQPSWEVFQVFDSLLLLKRGGETVYFGELGQNASELIQYFESVEGAARLEDGYNPATWMLEVIGAGVGNTAGNETDFVEIFNASRKKALLDANLDQDGVARPSPGLPALDFSNKRAATESTQAKFLVGRFMTMYWRTGSYNVTRLIVCIMLALIFGSAFFDSDFLSYQDINSGVGMVFGSTSFIGFVVFNSVLPMASAERASYYRERASQTYNALWYFVGASVVEIPYVVVSTLPYTAILFYMVGFSGAATFFAYWFHNAVFVLAMTYLGQLFAYAFPSVEVAAVMGALCNSIFVLFMGFNPPGSAIPQGYKWVYYITPQTYTLAILSATVFTDCDGTDMHAIGCQAMTNAPPTIAQNVTIKQYVEDVFLMKHDEIWRNCGLLVALLVVYRVLALLALRFINHQKK